MPAVHSVQRRAPAAAAAAAAPAPVSGGSIALTVIGVLALATALSIGAVLYRRRRQQGGSNTGTQLSTAEKRSSDLLTDLSPPPPAITLAPATPALSSFPLASPRTPVPISQLPMSSSMSTLGSAIVSDNGVRHEDDDDVFAQRPSSDDRSGLAQPETAAPAQRIRRRSSTNGSRKSRAIPSDLLASLGDLPSLPSGPSTMRRGTSHDSGLHRASRQLSTPAARRSVDSQELTPVLDMASNFRIASRIFGDSVGHDLWLSSVLDGAFDDGPGTQRQPASPSTPTRPTRSRQHSHHIHHEHTPTSPQKLTSSASMDTIGRRASSSRIPVSRSQRQYLGENPQPPSDMRSLPSDSDLSSSNSYHLSTRPSHGFTEHTAPTSVASTDNLSAIAASEAQVIRADLVQKLPATTMRASQVFSSRQRARVTQPTVGTSAQGRSSPPRVPSEASGNSSPSSSRDEEPQPRRKSKNRSKSDKASKAQHKQIQQSLLAAPGSLNGLKSSSDTDLHRGEGLKGITMHNIGSSPSLSASFTTPFHRALFPDEPVESDVSTGGPSSTTDAQFAAPSPDVSQMASTTPKISPKTTFVSQWRSKIARGVSLHMSPQITPSQSLNYVKSSSLASPSTHEYPSYEARSPDVSSSTPGQEEWHINTEDSRDDFSPIFTPTRLGFRDDEIRPSSGLGINRAHEGGEDNVAYQQGTMITLDAGIVSSSLGDSANPHRTREEVLSQRDPSRPGNKTSPIMQESRWAEGSSQRPAAALPPSPSLYEDDGKSFMTRTHEGSVQLDGASIFDLDVLNDESLPMQRRPPSGSLSPLEKLHFTPLPSCDEDQTTPKLSTGRFSGSSHFTRSPFSSGHRRIGSGKAVSRTVTTRHQVEDVVRKRESRMSDYTTHGSPQSEMGQFETTSYNSCVTAGMTEDGTYESISAVVTRAKLLQSIRDGATREQERQSRQLSHHHRRALEAESTAEKQRAREADPVDLTSIEEEHEESLDRTLTQARQSTHQAKKPQGLSIYVGNSGQSLDNGMVSPLTPPFTPAGAKTPVDGSQPARCYPPAQPVAPSSQGSQSFLRAATDSEESEDTVPDLIRSASSLGASGSGSCLSPFKLRPLSLSTSNSVLGDGSELRSPYSLHSPSAATPTKRTSTTWRTSKSTTTLPQSDSSGSLSSSTQHTAAMYSHLTAALGLEDHLPPPSSASSSLSANGGGVGSKRGSFVYRSAASGLASR